MGVVNVPSNVLDRLVIVERKVEEIRKLAGLTSAIIRRGGLTLLDDSFIKMVDDMGTEILYIGPNVDGKQIYTLRRENASVILQSGYFGGQPFFAMRDQNNVIIFSDNAAGLGGMARPWLPVFMRKCFRDRSVSNPVDPEGEVYGYDWITNSLIGGETILWEGTASILHKFMEISGIFGYALGTNAPTYRVRLNGTQVHAWTQNTGAIGMTTPRFDISPFIDQNGVRVTVSASAGGGSAGSTACGVQSVYMRQ